MFSAQRCLDNPTRTFPTWPQSHTLHGRSVYNCIPFIHRTTSGACKAVASTSAQTSSAEQHGKQVQRHAEPAHGPLKEGKTRSRRRDVAENNHKREQSDAAISGSQPLTAHSSMAPTSPLGAQAPHASSPDKTPKRKTVQSSTSQKPQTHASNQRVLTDSELLRFERDGFIVVRGLLSEEMVEALKQVGGLHALTPSLHLGYVESCA